jgi:hypothetical protein
MGCSCRTFVEEQSLLFSVRLPLKATGILDGFVCRQLDGAGRTNTTPSRVRSPRISLHLSSNSKSRNRAVPTGLIQPPWP